ncbi:MULTISPECIES: hypothetical protein [Pseudomonas]|uniref:hypothetical protein n=1 Tax=Pseudomonas TaxID=286 RepID=UPI0020CF6774|nr:MULTISPECIES: hypothetical protein [Pseudomonas]
MSSSIGKIISRATRKEYEAGTKLPRGWEIAMDLGFYSSIATTQVEGKRSKTLMEFSASKLNDLLKTVRAEHELVVEAPLKKKLKARLKKSKEKDAEITQLREEIATLKRSHAGEIKAYEKKVSEGQAATDAALEERNNAWNENAELNQEVKRAQEERDHAKSEYYEGGHAYETMKANLIAANEMLIAHNLLREDSPGIRPQWNAKDVKPRPYNPYSGGSCSSK